MTDQELDRMMRRVLLDSLKYDEASVEQELEPFVTSQKHQRQMKEMLKDPLKWLKNKTQPAWKLVAQKVAVILLVASVGLGSLMAVSPTVRAAVIQWVTEWYETHIVYFFSGEANSEELQKYEIENIPETFVETDRLENTSSVSVFYEDNCGGVICFDYFYMHQGAAVLVTTDENVIDIIVNGMLGQLFLPTDTKNTTTLVWFDSLANIQFTIDSTLSREVVIDMAESVNLTKFTKK